MDGLPTLTTQHVHSSFPVYFIFTFIFSSQVETDKYFLLFSYNKHCLFIVNRIITELYFRFQSPKQSIQCFTMIPQSSTHVRISYRNQYPCCGLSFVIGNGAIHIWIEAIHIGLEPLILGLEPFILGQSHSYWDWRH